jgi:hypothetical protein
MRFFVICLILFTHCSGRVTKATTSSESDTVRLNKLLETEVGTKHSQSFNTSKTYLLAVSEKEVTEVMNRYVLIEVATQKIIKKGTFRPGYIKWRDDTSLELLNAPGTMPTGKNLSDYTELISIPSNK